MSSVISSSRWVGLTISVSSILLQNCAPSLAVEEVAFRNNRSSVCQKSPTTKTSTAREGTRPTFTVFLIIVLSFIAISSLAKAEVYG